MKPGPAHSSSSLCGLQPCTLGNSRVSGKVSGRLLVALLILGLGVFALLLWLFTKGPLGAPREAGDATFHFLDVTASTGIEFQHYDGSSGPGFEVVECGRGSAVGDLDNDGDLDIVVLNSRTLPTLLRNDTANGNHWLQIRTRGTRSNRDGIGAQVFVTTDGRTRVAEVHSGRSYQSHYGVRLHFGLGENRSADRVVVRWPSGVVDVLEDVEGDRLVTVTEEAHQPSPSRPIPGAAPGSAPKASPGSPPGQKTAAANR